MQIEPIKGVIFDMDGTLVSSSLDFAAMRRAIDCPPDQDILDFIDALPDPETRQQAQQAIINIELEEAQQCQILDGVAEALQLFQRWQLPLGLVTRNSREATRIKLEKTDLSFDPIITRECAPAKPDPAALLQVADSWRIEPKNLIYVGDYLHDVNAANNAGMRSVLLTIDGEPEWPHDATWQCPDYATFLDIISPLVQK